MEIETVEKELMSYLDLPKNLGQIDFPSFEIENAAKKLFGLEEFHLKMEKQRSIETKEVTHFFASNPIHLGVHISSIDGEAYFLMSKDQIQNFCRFMFEIPSEQVDEDFTQALFIYSISKLLSALSTNGFTKNFSVQIIEHISLPTTMLFDLPITMQSNEKTAEMHLAMTPPFQQGFFEKFRKKQNAIPEELKRSLNISMGLEIGSTELNYQEVKGLKDGDFILLDRCTFDPETKHGNVSFMLGEKSIFRGKIKENEIKILDMPFQAIGEQAMDTPPFDENEEFNEKPEEMPAGHEPKVPEPNLDKEKGEEESWTKESMPTSENSAASPNSIEPAPLQTIAASQIPLNISVEVHRIQMNVEEFLKLQPGQTIQLGVSQEEGVDLVVGGKKVAKGELVKVQDLLGVRITKLFS